MVVSVPLRGVGCFETGSLHHRPARFPSPCGVWVVSGIPTSGRSTTQSFRPLAGCGLFLSNGVKPWRSQVSVPLRGVGCFL